MMALLQRLRDDELTLMSMMPDDRGVEAAHADASVIQNADDILENK